MLSANQNAEIFVSTLLLLEIIIFHFTLIMHSGQINLQP